MSDSEMPPADVDLDDEEDQQSRKRARASSDSDNSDSEKPQKKHRHPGAQFVDDIAVNEDDEDEPDEEESEDDGYDDDEEEEDNGDGELDEGEATNERGGGSSRKHKKDKKGRRRGVDLGGEDETMHMTLDQIRDREETALLAKQYEDKFKDEHYDEDYDEEGANLASSGAVLPSVRGPYLFIVRVSKGEREENIIFQLLQQYYKTELNADRTKRFHIHSAFTTPASRGHIYVEAFKPAHVELALQFLMRQRKVSFWEKKQVPITEMVSTIKFRSEHATVQMRQWVRFKRGPNRDDLAQVVNVQDQGATITVKYMPRIDYLYLAAKRKNEKLTQRQFGSGGPRPPQKYFDERELRSMGFPVEKKRGAGLDKHTTYFHFMNQKYRNGFQFKDIKIDNLETVIVPPSQDELEKFANRAVDSDDDEDSEERKAEEEAVAAATAATLASARRPVVYSMGDRVQITVGALRNVTGRVISISKDRLSIQADRADITMPIEEVLAHVRKYFSVGTNVKVVSGVHKGATGMICHVPEEASDKLAIAIHSLFQTIEVASEDLVESSEVSTGRDTFGNFELYDLVQLTNKVVGVITHVHMASFSVMTNHGSVQQIKLQEIQRKRDDRFSHTPDVHGSKINRDDIVTVVTGPERGKRAVVKHIHWLALFVQSREPIDNGRIFVIPGKQVELIGGRTPNQQKQMLAPRSPGAGSRSPGPAPQSPGRVAAGGGGFRGRDPRIGKDVVITAGNYKGFTGVCLDIPDGGDARVEIRAIFRKVSVPSHMVKLVEVTRVASSNPFYGSQTPLVGGATPAHVGFGGATPGHEMGGSMTPAHLGGSRTPSHRTPSHSGGDDVWAAQTPAHRGHDRIDEEDEEADEWQRSMGYGGASANTPHNPLTPGQGVPQTPRTPGVPPTPQVDPYSVVPATPAAPYETPMPGADEEPVEEPVSGKFTSSVFIGCHVRLGDDGPVIGVIVDVLAGGNVRIQSPTGGRSTHPASALREVQPGNNESAMFTESYKSFAVGTRTTILSTLNRDAVLDNGEVVSLDKLCKCDEEAVRDEEEEDDEDEEEARTNKKKVKTEKKKK